MSFLIHDPSSIAILATTHYPRWYRGKLRSIKHSDKIRGDLALEFVQKASEAGYQTIVADWKSARTFRKTLSSIERTLIIKRKSLKSAPSKRQLIKKAVQLADVKVIVLTEPEKVSLVTDCIKKIALPILEQKADIVVPKRNEKLFQTLYPDYQYESEQEANILYNEELKAHGLLSMNADNFDMFFGPRAFANTKKVSSLFMRRYSLKMTNLKLFLRFFGIEAYSEVLFFPIITALQKKTRVLSVEVPFSYPHTQKMNEEKGSREFFMYKRKVQKFELLIELLHFVSFLEKHTTSRIRER